MSKKILNVEIAPLITSECWTYYKFAIIQTFPFFDKWLANHMRIYMLLDGNMGFGDHTIYPLSYYSDILECSEKCILSVTAEEITRYLMDQIDQGVYVILDLNFPRLYDIESTNFILHETLIYGYDAEQRIFYAPLLKNGVFKEVMVPFENIEKAYKDVFACYSQDTDRLFRRRAWFAPITLLKPKEQYENINAYYDFYSKIKYEHAGYVYMVCDSNDGTQGESPFYLYKGLSVMRHLSELLRQAVACSEEEGQKNCEKYYRSCLKIYEHQNMIYRSMKWFLGEMGADSEDDSEELRELVEQYQKCCEKMRLNVSIIQKYLLTQNTALIIHIADVLDEVLPKEQKILEAIIKIVPRICTVKKLMA